jgi:hypothetical protein
MPRRHTMDRTTPTIEKAAPPPEKRTRRWVPAVAAAVVALIVVGTMLFLGDRGTPEPAAPEISEEARIAAAIEAAEAYFEASASGDVERARSLVAEGFRTDEAPTSFRGLASLEWGLRLHAAYEFEHRDFDCALDSVSPRLLLRCEGMFHYGVDRRTPTYAPEATAFLVSFDDAGSIVRVVGGPMVDRQQPETTDQDVLDWQAAFDPWVEWTAFIERVDPDFAALNERAMIQRELGPEEAAEFFEKLTQYLDLYEAHAAEAHEAWLRDRQEG